VLKASDWDLLIQILLYSVHASELVNDGGFGAGLEPDEVSITAVDEHLWLRHVDANKV